MMELKYYIFLVHTVVRIGGAELYLSRKIDYLLSQGWHCEVFYYYSNGSIVIPNLKPFEYNNCPELRFAAGNAGKKRRQLTKSKVAAKINPVGTVMIESFSPTLATWGEYLAKEFNAKHLAYLIDEHISSPTQIMSEFLKFKISQNLLFCIRNEVLASLSASADELGDRTLRAIGCSTGNVVDYVLPEVESISNDTLNILCLGRLNKAYIPHLFEAVASFAKSYSQYKFKFVVVGDSPNKRLKNKLFGSLKSASNLSYIHLGFVWPMPKNLFQKIDVMLGVAGCVVLSHREGVPCISIDSTDFEAIGIFGETTMNNIFRGDMDGHCSIYSCLEDVLIRKKYTRRVPQEEPKLDYSSHQVIIDRKFDGKYFDTWSSKLFLSHRYIRKIAILIDLNPIGNKLIQKLWSLSLFKKLVSSINHNGLSN